MSAIEIEKEDGQELPVPTVWRKQLKRIADQVLKGDVSPIEGVRSIDPEAVEVGLYNISKYPEKIVPLQIITWDSSIYTWLGTHWETLVDLTGESGKTSDLVLHVSVHEFEDRYEFEVGLIYVP